MSASTLESEILILWKKGSHTKQACHQTGYLSQMQHERPLQFSVLQQSSFYLQFQKSNSRTVTSLTLFMRQKAPHGLLQSNQLVNNSQTWGYCYVYKHLQTLKTLKSTETLCGSYSGHMNVLGPVVVNSLTKGDPVNNLYMSQRTWKTTYLLGLPGITALQLITKVDSIQSRNVQKGFPKLFWGLGTLKGDYQI